MLVAINDVIQNGVYMESLSSILKPYISFTGERTIGFQSGNQLRTLSYSRQLGIYWYFGQEDGYLHKYWNVFGVENPEVKKNLNIAVEINLPRTQEKRYPGLWAKNENGNIFLLHSGKIGGGQKGIGQSLFFQEYKGEIAQVQQNKGLKNFAMVLELNSDKAPFQLASFVKQVREIKDNRKLL